MAEYLQVSTTTEKRKDAERIAAAVVEAGLAACAQLIGPISSTYRWKGRIQRAEEWLCIIKSRSDLYPELEKMLQELHPYEEPEIIATAITGGSESYLKWLDSALRK